jgi:hypothetical protein
VHQAPDRPGLVARKGRPARIEASPLCGFRCRTGDGDVNHVDGAVVCVMVHAGCCEGACGSSDASLLGLVRSEDRVTRGATAASNVRVTGTSTVLWAVIVAIGSAWPAAAIISCPFAAVRSRPPL